MATSIDICNLALSMIGEESTITSLDPPDGSDEAGNCARWYPQALRACLEAYDWSFATRRVHPAQLSPQDETLYDWERSFLLPSDMARLINVRAGAERRRLDFTEYEIESYLANGALMLLCNEASPTVTYVAYLQNVSVFPASFLQCVVLRLAMFLIGPTHRPGAPTQAVQGLQQQYLQAIMEAKNADARATYRRQRPYVAEHIRAREV